MTSFIVTCYWSRNNNGQTPKRAVRIGREAVSPVTIELDQASFPLEEKVVRDGGPAKGVVGDAT